MFDPWLKATYPYDAFGKRLKLQVPHDVFSTQRIDEGTVLLLAHLAETEPAYVLDMGCGYGALGLPIAAKFPAARVEMVDRDLLAVEWAGRNAKENGLSNAEAFGSLGFRDVKGSVYDWILCNVPARIGRPFIENLIQEGRSRLTSKGDLRLVVIHDLAPILIELKEHHGWPLKEVARGARHTVFSLGAAKSQVQQTDLYLRDTVEVDGMRLDRPFDLGGDDPKRLTKGLPVLFDALPRQAPKVPFRSILTFRCGYGPMPLVARRRWPETKVVAVDRDLLGTAFVRRNAEKLGLGGPLLEVRENSRLEGALTAGETFSLVLGELSPSAGEKVAHAELEAVLGSLEKGGRAYLLCLDKIEKEWVRPFAAKKRIALLPLISRDGHVVLNFTKD